MYDSTNHVAKVNGDVVFQESHTTYVESGDYTNDAYTGLVELATTHLRTDAADDTDTGDLASMTSDTTDDVHVITTYAASWYDGGNRPIRSVNYGTNRDGWTHSPSGTNDTPSVDLAATPPSWDTSGDEIVSEMSYNTRGMVDITTDPAGIETKVIYDDMSRQIAVIENFDDAALASTPWDNDRWCFDNFTNADQTNARDRITSFVYNGNGATVKQVAHLFVDSTEELQETEYVYGVSKTGTDSSLISNEDLLFKVHYPDESSGTASTGATYTVTYTYNRLGEVVTMTDQNKVEHAYIYDDRGALTLDEVTFPGSGSGSNLDQTINAIGTSYDSLGRRSKVTSYSDYGGGSQAVENEVEFVYNDDIMGALVSLKQQHDGSVGGSSPVVEYSYSTEDVDDGNYQRLNVIEYPSWLERLSVYGTSGSSSDTISRQTAVERQNFFISSHSQLANYQYIGLGMITEVDYVRPDIQLDFKAAHNGERNDGDYPGYDRFGRVVKQHWVDGNFDEHASDTSVPNVPPLVEIDYSYDKVGNRTKLIDGRPGASWNNRDRLATTRPLHNRSRATV